MESVGDGGNSVTDHDAIALTGLRATAFHGVLEHERREGQLFLIDLVVHVDVKRAAASDDLGDTVDYSLLAAQAVAAVESDPVNLIETVAERVAMVALAHGLVRSVEVTIHKPGAPIGVQFADVSVTIYREKS